MMDIKINGNTYNDVERVRLVRADGLGTYSVAEMDLFDATIMGNDWDGEYYNSAVTKIGAQWPFGKTKRINLPNVTTAINNAFYNRSVVEARLPALTETNGGLFLSATNLEKVVFGKKFSAFNGQDLRACSALKTVVLPYEGVVTFNVPSQNPFQDSGVAAGTGYVYVPSAQVEAYKAHANWSAYANQIRAIEDYPEETA